MKTYPKKKLEIIAEAPFRRRILAVLDKLDVKGYTVLPALEGRGPDGRWEEGQISSAGHMIQIVCILDPDRMDAILSPIFETVKDSSGIVYVSNVEVVRDDHF